MATKKKYLNEVGVQALINRIKSALTAFYVKEEADSVMLSVVSNQTAPINQKIEQLELNEPSYCQELEVDEDGLLYLLNNG